MPVRTPSGPRRLLYAYGGNNRMSGGKSKVMILAGSDDVVIELPEVLIDASVSEGDSSFADAERQALIAASDFESDERPDPDPLSWWVVHQFRDQLTEIAKKHNVSLWAELEENLKSNRLVTEMLDDPRGAVGFIVQLPPGAGLVAMGRLINDIAKLLDVEDPIVASRRVLRPEIKGHLIHSAEHASGDN